MINYKFIYNFALVILFPFAVIYFTYISIKNNDLNFIKNRLGLVTKLNNQNNICVHCASLGEVNGATGLIKEIEKNHSLFISTNTLSGMKRIKELFPKLDVVYFPLDYKFIVSSWLKLTKVKSVIIYETEIWLNFYKVCNKYNIKLCIVNARLQKNLHKTKFVKRIYLEALEYCDLILCKSEYEKEKYTQLGIKGKDLITMGNLKYAYKPDQNIRSNNDLKNINNYFLMVSTHDPDEINFLPTIKWLMLKGTLTVIAPRHIKRSKEISNLFKSHNISSNLLSEINGTEKKLIDKNNILIIDSFGDLPQFYSNAKYIYVGGGFSIRGVQNIIEPSVFGKPIIIGPNIDNFYDEINSLKKQNGITIIEENENISEQDNIKKTFTEFYNLDDDLLIEMGQTAKTHSLKYEKIVEKYSTILQERKIIN